MSAARPLQRVAPLYVEHLLRFSREGGKDPPSRLADLIALRIERLPVDARRVLQAVAVIGDQTVSAQLVALLPDVRELRRYIDELDDAGLIGVNDGLVSTSHPFVRDVTLASTPAAVRSGLHARARRDFGVDQGPPPLEADALHAFHAGESFEALMLLERAAAACRDRDDSEGSVAALSMALNLARREMARGELDDPVAAVLMFSCKLGDALLIADKHNDAEGVLTEALDLAGPSSPERSRILASLAHVAQREGRADAAYQRLDEALRIAERGNNAKLLDTLEQMRQRWVAGL
jgi:tetratricopeptide (TPR) repeat protein